MIENKNKFSAVFLDRDGVINEDRGYVHRIEDFFFLPGAISGMQLFQKMGYKIVIITNQAGIAKGIYTENDFEKLNNYMIETLSKNNIKISGVYYCPHHPNGIINQWISHCNCRKPNPGMIIRAAKDLNLQLQNSILLGDNCSDINAGINGGVPMNILIKSKYLIERNFYQNVSYVTDNIMNAALWIKDSNDLNK